MKILERLLKLQTRIASSASDPVSGNVQSPVSHPQYSSSAKAHAAPPVSPKPPVPMYRLLLWNFLLQGRTGQWGKIRRIGNNFENSATKNHGAGENCCTKKSLWTLLMKTRRTRANKSGRAEEAAMATMRTVGRPRPPAATQRWMRTRPASSPPQQQPGSGAPPCCLRRRRGRGRSQRRMDSAPPESTPPGLARLGLGAARDIAAWTRRRRSQRRMDSALPGLGAA